jgi:hypothetical protein
VVITIDSQNRKRVGCQHSGRAVGSGRKVNADLTFWFFCVKTKEQKNLIGSDLLFTHTDLHAAHPLVNLRFGSFVSRQKNNEIKPTPSPS